MVPPPMAIEMRIADRFHFHALLLGRAGSADASFFFTLFSRVGAMLLEMMRYAAIYFLAAPASRPLGQYTSLAGARCRRRRADGGRQVSPARRSPRHTRAMTARRQVTPWPAPDFAAGGRFLPAMATHIFPSLLHQQRVRLRPQDDGFGA